MTGRELIRLALAVVLSAAVAFAVGMRFAGSSAESRPAPSGKSAAVRQVFSPRVLSDPYFLDRQRRNAAALAQRCREGRQYCAEAAALQRWLDRQAAR
jgi:hypothetical protein